MSDSATIKEIFTWLGADICGIAPVERFDQAPRGFHPTDIHEKCESVVAFARRLPAEPLFTKSCVPYTQANNLVTREVDAIAFNASIEMEDLGIRSVLIPSDDPYEYWEQENLVGMGILSLRHAGQLAGLGVLGRNTLLVNKDFGNMIQIGAVLVDATLDGDPVAAFDACGPDCSLCLDSCPENALDGKTVNQKLCRPLTNYVNERGFILKKCSVCRRVCPNALGIDR